MTPTSESRRPLNVFLHVVFFLSGIVTVLIGQVLPILAAKFTLDDLQAGYLFPAQFAGSLTGTFLTNFFGRRGKFFQAAVLGSFLMAAGVLLLNSQSFAICLVGFVVTGLGIGLTLPSINLLILETNPERAASALNILNFCWGAGAIICKPFVDFLHIGQSIATPTIILAIPLIAFGAAIGFLPKRPEEVIEPASGTAGPGPPIWTTTLAWAIALFNFIHIGFESGMGGWLTTYADRVDPSSAMLLVSPTLIYFVCFVLGRGLAPIYFRYLSENIVLLISLFVILIGLVITISGENIFQIGLGAAISGFGTSSVFPTNVSRFRRIFGPEASRRAIPLFVAGTSGATLITWLIGFISKQTDDLRFGMLVLLGGVVVLIVLQIGLMMRKVQAEESVA